MKRSLEIRNMNKKIILFFSILAICTGCEKKSTTGANDSAKEYFDAWIHVNYPDLAPTPLGAYVISDTEGTGAALGDGKDYPYVRVEFTVSDLKGNINSTSREDVAKRIGKYNETYYYGPSVWKRSSVYAGLEESLAQMKVGGVRKVIIPGWLTSKDRYSTQQEYLDKVTGKNAIYEFEVVEAVNDISKWEIDSIGRYVEANCEGLSAKDSVKLGFYYLSHSVPQDSKAFDSDTTIYINYTGRLLNGRVFDTTIKDTAVMYGIYSSKNKYTPKEVKYYKDDYSQITLAGNKVIGGFSYTIHKMKPYEKASGIFISEYGYSSSGTGNTIPPYAALRFDIEIVDKP